LSQRLVPPKSDEGGNAAKTGTRNAFNPKTEVELGHDFQDSWRSQEVLGEGGRESNLTENFKEPQKPKIICYLFAAA
jgi:hypothetical protein